jgi:hypothetical protein
MTYSDSYKKSVIAEAKENIRRQFAAPVTFEHPAERWRREMGELDVQHKRERQERKEASFAERRIANTVQQLQGEVQQIEHKLLAVAKLSASLCEKLDALEAKITEGKSSSTEIVELPNFVKRQRP